ncbi:MAG: methyltransferase domain-containing protein [Bacteroidetes bacterium]|nr:methyltransferase domain-containing protein [Bacteroidota bacterium]
MSSKTKQVEKFFHSYAGGFDSIYGHTTRRSKFDKWVDKTFRKTMFLRFEETLKNTANPEIHSVLDIGCGSGRYIIEFLLQGKDVTGIDLAQGMIDIAKSQTEKIDHKGRKQFIIADYMQYDFDRQFDAACLMGVFDYIEKPVEMLKKLKRDISKEIYASFPHDSGLLAFQRKIRYKIRECPLYYYSYNDVVNLLKEAGLDKNFEIVDFKRDYFVKIILNK